MTPAATGGWDTYPALSELMPWYSPGVFPTRTWVFGPSASILRTRWYKLMAETDEEAQAMLFKKTRDASMDKVKASLPGSDTHQASSVSLRDDTSTKPEPIRVGYRSFDRQWVLPDARLMDMPRPPLWSARIPGQVFVFEMHSKPIKDGPGVVFSALIPSYDYFKGSGGGRTLPYLHPDGTANLASGFTDALTAALGLDVTSSQVLAYIAAVIAHPAYTATFTDELMTPGIRVPLTANPELWDRAVKLGERVIWLHTYGASFSAGQTRPAGDIRYPDNNSHRPLCTKAITTMPVDMSYDEARHTLVMGDGEFAPVSPEVSGYTVGGMNVIGSWFNYRKKDPGGKKMTPLDHINPKTWDPDWTAEAIDLITVLTGLVQLEPTQAELLGEVLAGDLLSIDDLTRAGTQWPVTPEDRKPRFTVKSLKEAPEGEGALFE